jgi:hypothetical protein
MASLEQFRAMIEPRPFKPIAISTAGGRTFIVRHPENVACSVDGVSMTVYDENGMHLVDMQLVDVMEAAPSSPEKPRKGKGAKK